MINVTVWGENVHERTNEVVRKVYPSGMHAVIANGLSQDPDIETTTATGRNVAVVHIFAGTNFEVQKAGKVNFKLPAGLVTEAWVNGQPLKRGNQFTTELKPGKHRIVIRLDAKALPKALRLESKDVAFLND